MFSSIFPKNAFSGGFSDRAEVSISEWFSFADSSWQISGSFGATISKLEFDDIDSYIPIVTAEIKPFSWLAVDFSYGSGSIGNGTTIDSDWIFNPSSGSTDFLTSKSKSTIVDDNTMFYSFNLYFDMFKLMGLSRRSTSYFDFFLGYTHYQDKIRFTNAVQTIINEIEVSSPIAGVNSTYDFFWNALRAGLRTGHQFPSDFFVSGVFGFFPFIDYSGEAFWNLRSDYRFTKPNFEHDATGTFGLDLNLTTGYAIKKWIVLSAGYSFLYMRAKNGTGTTYLSDGTSIGTQLDKVEVSRHGPFVSISLTY